MNLIFLKLRKCSKNRIADVKCTAAGSMRQRFAWAGVMVRVMPGLLTSSTMTFTTAPAAAFLLPPTAHSKQEQLA